MWDARKDLHSPTEALEFREIERAIKTCLHDPNAPEFYNACKRALLFLHKFVPAPTLKGAYEYPKPLDCIPEFHPYIIMKPPQEDKFQTTKTSRGSKPAIFVLNEGENILFSYVAQCPNKNWLLPYYKIKSLISTSREKGYSLEQTQDVIRSKCRLWRSGKLPPIRDFAWFIPYIPLEVYYYGYATENQFFEYLRCRR